MPGSLVDTAKEWGGWGFNMAKEAGKKAVTEGKKVKHTLSVRPKFHCRIRTASLIDNLNETLPHLPPTSNACKSVQGAGRAPCSRACTHPRVADGHTFPAACLGAGGRGFHGGHHRLDVRPYHLPAFSDAASVWKDRAAEASGAALVECAQRRCVGQGAGYHGYAFKGRERALLALGTLCDRHLRSALPAAGLAWSWASRAFIDRPDLSLCLSMSFLVWQGAAVTLVRRPEAGLFILS